MTKEYVSPYSLLFFKGFCQFFYLIIISIFVFCYTDTYSYINTIINLSQRIIIRIFLIMLNMGRSIFLIQVIDKFSSPHISIVKVFQSLFMFLFKIINSWITSIYKKEENGNTVGFENIIILSSFFIMG